MNTLISNPRGSNVDSRFDSRFDRFYPTAIDLAINLAVHVLGLEALKEQQREAQCVFKRQESSLFSKARPVSAPDTRRKWKTKAYLSSSLAGPSEHGIQQTL